MGYGGVHRLPKLELTPEKRFWWVKKFDIAGIKKGPRRGPYHGRERDRDAKQAASKKIYTLRERVARGIK